MSRALELALAAIIGAALALQLAPERTGPRLVGYGCIGAGGPLYADAESDFPQCAEIVRTGERGARR